MGVLNMMKKYTILLILLVILTGCKGKDEFNVEKIEAPKDYELFDNLTDKLDIENAGLSIYDYDKELAFLLDISKEADYEKYFYKNYLDENSVAQYDDEMLDYINNFMDNGSSISSAYKFISYMFDSKSKLLELARRI